MSTQTLSVSNFRAKLPTSIVHICKRSPEYAGEIWQTVNTRLSGDNPPANPQGWASRTTWNEIYRQRHREAKERAKRDAHLERLHFHQLSSRGQDDPATIAAEIDEKGFQFQKLKKWLPDLDERERVALLASFSIPGFPKVANLAKTWGCTDRNVRHLKQRALRKLRRRSEEECSA